jgi:8-oxo-dGTP diphosphatase
MSAERHTARLVTLSFVTSDGDVLLRRHPDGSDRFPGRWNGIGGHVEAGECILDAARRELREETGLDVADLALRGVVHEAGLLGRAHVLFVFRGTTRERRVRDDDTGAALCWQPLAQLRELPLVADFDALVRRSLEDGPPFFGVEHFDGGDRATHVRIAGELHAVR